MGRVAKYKKIKACDPYSKKNGGKVDLSTVGVWGIGDNGRKPKKRSRRAEQLRASRKRKAGRDDEGFDLPPSARKDEFDMKDLVGSVKKQKIASPLKETQKEKDLYDADRVRVNGNIATIPKSDRDEKKAARILNVQTQVKKEVENKEKKNYTRMEGESKNAYSKRTKAETRQIIKQTRTETQNPEKKEKKKQFLKNKKGKKKKGNSTSLQNYYDGSRDDDQDSDVLITGERAIALVDEVKFGEQAERPPIFRQLPRGAASRTKNGTETKASKGMSAEDVDAESKAMDLMRRKLQAQYNAVKQKRRRAGDFHL